MIKKIFLFSFLLLSLAACAQKNNNTSYPLQKEIAQIIKTANIPINLGILVIAPSDNKVLYALNSQQPFVPASNLKLYTAAAALLYLGPNYTFQTTLATNAENPTGPQLNGDVYLKFSGDPDLTLNELAKLIQTLKAKGITTIKGNFYLDTSAMDQENFGPGWMWDELNWCYAAPINSIMLDHNCYNIALAANKKVGTNSNIALLPKYSQFITINNNVIIAAPSKSTCNINIHYLANNHYQLTGCLPQAKSLQTIKIAVHNPELWTAHIIMALLHENQIHLNGKISLGIVPANSTNLASYQSRPLAILVRQMLKKSDNQIANILLKTLGHVYYKQPGNWQNGVAALQAILKQQLNIDFTHSNIVDGSGISRYNLVTPEQTAQLLLAMYNNKKLAPIFISSLPVAGVNGTLADRMQEAEVKGKIYAKTGTMTGVSSLSGYATTQENHKLIFVIFSNNFVVPNNQVTALEDNICRFLVKQNF